MTVRALRTRSSVAFAHVAEPSGLCLAFDPAAKSGIKARAPVIEQGFELGIAEERKRSISLPTFSLAH
jgi:hypothetical protein